MIKNYLARKVRFFPYCLIKEIEREKLWKKENLVGCAEILTKKEIYLRTKQT